MRPRRHQSGDMRYIRHEIRSHLPGRGGEPPEVDDAAVRRRTGDDELRLQLPGQPLHSVIVDDAVFVHLVGVYVVQLPGRVHRQPVGKMPAVGETHGQNAVARLQQRQIRCQIGGCPAVGLHIHMVVGGKHLLPLGDAVLLQLVHHVAAAVIPSLISHGPVSRIALGILIRQAAAHRAAHRLAGKIFAGDQLHRLRLPPFLPRNIVKYPGCHPLHSHFSYNTSRYYTTYSV